MSITDNTQEPLIERLSASPEPASADEGPARKRKRESKSASAEKKSASKKRKTENDGDLDMELGVNKAFSSMDSQLLADHLAQKTRKFESDLSSVELEDRYISAKSLRDTTNFEKSRTLDNLPFFLESFVQNPTKLWSSSKKNGTPHTIVVAGAALRAADITRVLKKLQAKESTVAKLFAKHIKLKDAVKFLQSNRTGIAVGTPVRLNDLMSEGGLQVDRLERIIIDASYIDQKKRGILDMKETEVPLVQWLNREEFKSRYGVAKDGIDLIFF